MASDKEARDIYVRGIDSETYEQIRELAEDEDRSMPNMARQLLKEAVQDRTGPAR